MKKVLITGGAGFIGSQMVAYKLAQGNQVRAIDNLITGRKGNLNASLSNPNFTFEEADLNVWAGLIKAVEWADEIFHLAATVGQKFVINHPVHTITNNIESCEVLLKAMAEVNSKARLIVASTSELYSQSALDAKGTVSEETPIHFLNKNFFQETYSVSKLVNELMTLSYAHEKGLMATVARIFNTIGIPQTSAYGMVVPSFIEQATQNKPITVYGDGLQTRSFCDVRDTVRALDLLLNCPAAKGEIVNVGNDKPCKIIDLAHLIKKMANSPSEIVFIDYETAYGMPFIDVMARCPDLSKLKRLTGFEPKYSLHDTIEYILKAKAY